MPIYSVEYSGEFEADNESHAQKLFKERVMKADVTQFYVEEVEPRRIDASCPECGHIRDGRHFDNCFMREYNFL